MGSSTTPSGFSACICTVALSGTTTLLEAPASQIFPIGSVVAASATSSTPESIVFCQSCTPVTSRPVRRIFEFTPSVFATVTRVLPEITNFSALWLTAIRVSFFTSKGLGAATADEVPIVRSASKSAVRFIIEQVLLLDEQMQPSHLQQSVKFLLHQIPLTLLLSHL